MTDPYQIRLQCVCNPGARVVSLPHPEGHAETCTDHSGPVDQPCGKLYIYMQMTQILENDLCDLYSSDVVFPTCGLMYYRCVHDVLARLSPFLPFFWCYSVRKCSRVSVGPNLIHPQSQKLTFGNSC